MAFSIFDIFNIPITGCNIELLYYRREPGRNPWIENRSVRRRVPQRDGRLLEPSAGARQRLRADRMLPGHVPQPDIVHIRLQRAQLRGGHGLFR